MLHWFVFCNGLSLFPSWKLQTWTPSQESPLSSSWPRAKNCKLGPSGVGPPQKKNANIARAIRPEGGAFFVYFLYTFMMHFGAKKIFKMTHTILKKNEQGRCEISSLQCSPLFTFGTAKILGIKIFQPQIWAIHQPVLGPSCAISKKNCHNEGYLINAIQDIPQCYPAFQSNQENQQRENWRNRTTNCKQKNIKDDWCGVRIYFLYSHAF